MSRGMKMRSAAIHSRVRRNSACLRPGGRSRGSGAMESQRSTDMAVRVNTLAATATPVDKCKPFFKILVSIFVLEEILLSKKEDNIVDTGNVIA